MQSNSCLRFILGLVVLSVHGHSWASAPDAQSCAGAPLGAVLVRDSTVIVGDMEGRVYSVDMEAWSINWTASVAGPVLMQSAAHDSGIVVVPSFSGSLDAFRASGEPLWQFAAGKVDHDIRDSYINGSPTIWHDSVIFSSEDFNLYSVDIQTGKENWRHRLPEEPQARRVPVVDDIAYVGTWDGHLYAINAHDGSLVWRSETKNDHRGKTVRTDDGALRWQSDRSDGEIGDNQAPYVTVVPIIGEDLVIFGDWSGNVLAVDTETGIQRWWYRAKTADVRRAGPTDYLMQVDGLINFTTADDRHWIAIDRRGREVWRHRFARTAYGPIPISDAVGAFYLAPGPADDGAVVEVWDLSTRTRRFDSRIITGVPVMINEQKMVAGLADGSLAIVGSLDGLINRSLCLTAAGLVDN